MREDLEKGGGRKDRAEKMEGETRGEGEMVLELGLPTLQPSKPSEPRIVILERQQKFVEGSSSGECPQSPSHDLFVRT